MRQCTCKCNSRCVGGNVPWLRLRAGPPRVGKEPRRRFGRSLQAGGAVHFDTYGQEPRNVCANRPNIFGRSSRPIFTNRRDIFAPPPQQAGASRLNIFCRSRRSIFANRHIIFGRPPHEAGANRPNMLARPSPAILANRPKSEWLSPPLLRLRQASSAL